jgi:hypothetical protein
MTQNDTQEQISQQIFSSIDQLSAFMQNIPDLANDVVPFMTGAFAKIKQLSVHQNKFEVSYELMQIATNYLPKSIHAYCALPIDYRNSKPIKNSKTARDLLIGDLTLIKKQVYELESTIFSDLEREIRVNSNLIKEKFEGQMQLATQMETENSSGFINQFNLTDYTNSPNYFESIFHKTMPAPNVAEKTVKTLTTTGNTVLKSSISISKKICSKIKPKLINAGKNIARIDGQDVFVTIMFSVFALFMGGLFSLIYFDGRYSSYVRDFNKDLVADSQFMGVTPLTQNQLTEFANKDYKELIDGSDYRKENIKYTLGANKLNITAKSIEKSDCTRLIDHQVESFPNIHLEINGIAIHDSPPTTKILDNTNYNLCYLKSGNVVNAIMDTKEIYLKNHIK